MGDTHLKSKFPTFFKQVLFIRPDNATSDTLLSVAAVALINQTLPASHAYTFSDAVTSAVSFIVFNNREWPIITSKKVFNVVILTFGGQLIDIVTKSRPCSFRSRRTWSVKSISKKTHLMPKAKHSGTVNYTTLLMLPKSLRKHCGIEAIVAWVSFMRACGITKKSHLLTCFCFFKENFISVIKYSSSAELFFI